MHELILGGCRSGKSRTAESRAADWLAAAPGREAVLVATALAGDEEMRARIARHRADRAQRLPALTTVEVPHDLPGALRERARPQRLVVVDCLTLWLTQRLMPPGEANPVAAADDHADGEAAVQALCDALGSAPGPVVLVSNEIGLGVMPLSREARRFVDTLGGLHQRVAAIASRVTLMVAGIETRVKG